MTSHAQPAPRDLSPVPSILTETVTARSVATTSEDKSDSEDDEDEGRGGGDDEAGFHSEDGETAVKGRVPSTLR